MAFLLSVRPIVRCRDGIAQSDRPYADGEHLEEDATNAETTRIFAGAGAAPSRNSTASVAGLFRRTVGDGAWKALDNGLPAGAEVHATRVRPDDPDVIFAGTADGPYRSTDGGDQWHKLNFSEPNVMIWSLTIHPSRRT